MSFVKKENICIGDTYTDSQGTEKKAWKTIGEIITMNGSDGPYQFIKLWGPDGFTEAKVFAPREDNQQSAQQQQAPRQNQQAPQQNYQPQQGGYQQR